MKLQYKINLASLGILLAVGVAISLAGAVTIDHLTYDLNRKLLSTELDKVMGDVAEAQEVLVESGVADVASYIQSAKAETVRDLINNTERRFGHLAVISLPDTVVLHEDVPPGRPYDLPCLPEMEAGGAGMTQCAYGGKEWVHFYRIFPQWNWLIILSASTDEMLAMRQTFLRSVLVILGVSLALGGLILITLTHGIVAPVQQLAAAAMTLSRGKFDERLPRPRSNDEVAELTRAFGVMADNLAVAHRNLERQTRELTVANRNLNLEVSERIKAEQDLASLNRRLEELVEQRTRDLMLKAEELEAANRRLLEMDELKSAFLSSVSHELRTPLTSILGFAKVISKDFKRHYAKLGQGDHTLVRIGTRIHGNLEIIDHEGRRLTRMVNDLLDLAKIESGRVEWNDQVIAPAQIVARAVDSVRGAFLVKSRVRLEVVLADDLPVIRADPDRMEQVLLNLLHNAAKFTDTGSVRVRAETDVNGDLLVSVSDTGMGISPENLEKVFDKFHQVMNVDTRLDKPMGTGLGLAICRQIVEHYGGGIWVESVQGNGATFYVRLPAMDRQDRDLAPGGV